MTAAYLQRKQEIEALVRQLQENLRPWSVGDADRGNHVGLLVNGQATFDSILGRIAQARRYVLYDEVGRLPGC